MVLWHHAPKTRTTPVQVNTTDLLMNKVKYPRTHHVPFSPGMTDDDRVVPDMSAFQGRRIVVTEKMDGENTTLYTHGLHARSLDSGSHPSRDWLKAFHAAMAGNIPENFRVCGENLYARHSIDYPDLESYFYGFSIWEGLTCMAWDETLEWFGLLDIQPVPVLYDGPFDPDRLQHLHQDQRQGRLSEGWVMRVADAFDYKDFRTHVAKYVRQGHVMTGKHWMHGPMVANRLCDGVAAYGSASQSSPASRPAPRPAP